MDAATVTLLQELVRKEGRSLLQYVSESFPWTTHKDQHVVPILLQMAKEERDGATDLVKLLVANRARPPYLGAYPMSFTTINYMSLAFLFPYLIDFEKRRSAELEKDLAIVADEPARQALQKLLEMKRRHLLELTSVTGVDKPAA